MTDIDRAVAVLRSGGLVAFPTETVYGLGADASNDAAVRRVFEVKGRPSDHPLIVHLSDASHLEDWAANVSSNAKLLADAFWPGPLTLLLERSASVSPAVTGGRASCARSSSCIGIASLLRRRNCWAFCKSLWSCESHDCSARDC